MRKLFTLGTAFFFLMGSVLVAQDPETAEDDAAAADDMGTASSESMTPKKMFSLGLAFGLKSDMAALGNTIAQDGTVDTAGSTIANQVYSTGQVLMSDRNNMAIYHNSGNTNSAYNLLGSEPTVGNPMLGMDIGLQAQYEFDELFFPMFARTSFHYIFKISGGEQSRTLGDAASESTSVNALLTANGLDPADYVGGTMKSTYNASWMEIPITLGFKVPITGRTFAYAGIGVSFFQGGFSVDMDIDEKYANALATHIDADAFTAENLSPGAVKETVEFKIGAMGINYLLGAQTQVTDDLALFLELNASGTAKTVYSSKISDKAQKLLTATSSQTLAQEDPNWFKRLAFPVVVGGGSVRLGAKYYLF